MRFASCGADTSSCAIVVRTPYARLFGGTPNVHRYLGSGQAKFQSMRNLDARSNEVVIATVELGTKHRTRTS